MKLKEVINIKQYLIAEWFDVVITRVEWYEIVLETETLSLMA
ncbi:MULTISPECIES: hypothetical protein [Spiroplasma]|uniref:Uncharacterized protein n=1 Tax=Spiroplasma litorale TaxID=216942 RepID=A0A0K1W0T4_9MOLU|nr:MULTISPECIES: hypothetical protein [Spiroplasma]AKX33786.1 hypothetical protein SLITO_v1c01180 [Spiroplasma litorale]ALX70390.1 hypothetical protein STURO_v1c01210 [Spiroplasma turonicum]